MFGSLSVIREGDRFVVFPLDYKRNPKAHFEYYTLKQMKWKDFHLLSIRYFKFMHWIFHKKSNLFDRMIWKMKLKEWDRMCPNLADSHSIYY